MHARSGLQTDSTRIAGSRVSRLFGAPLLMVAFVLGGCSDPLIEAYCSIRLPQAHFEVQTEMDEVTYVHGLTRDQLAERMTTTGAPVFGQTVGLTTVALQHTVNFDITGASGPGFACARPDIKVRLTASNPSVAVASDLVEGTCSYQQVLDHEQMHVRTYRDSLESAAQQVQAALQERYAGSALLRADSGTQLPELHRKELDEWLVPVIESALARVEQANHALDTREEYERLAAACGTDL